VPNRFVSTIVKHPVCLQKFSLC